MLGVDRLKGLHLRATDALCGRRIVFHHVPKCGGTSVGRALRRAYFLSQGTVKPHESEQAFQAAQADGRQLGDVFALREMMLLYLLYCDTRCIAAHVPFSDAAFERFAANYAFVTILRDPVERFVSNFFWNNRRSNDEARTTQAFEHFLGTEEAARAGSTYVRYFSGNPGRQNFTANDVAAAIANLRRMQCIGFLDDLDTFSSDLHRLTGRSLRIGKENVTRSGGREFILSSPLRGKVLAACSADREVWDAVQDLRKAAASTAVHKPRANAQRAAA